MNLTMNLTKRVRQVAVAAFATTLMVGAAQGLASATTAHVVADIVAEGFLPNGMPLTTTMELNAIVLPNGSVAGDFNYTSGEHDYAIGEPTGIYLEGNRAYVSVLVTSGMFGEFDTTGFTFNFWVDDNGFPGNTGDIQALGGFLPVVPYGLDPVKYPGFRAFLDTAPRMDVVEGNILVQE